MEKVLILSYFYPPSNFVGAQRTASWAKYLNEFGYYPILITRKWNFGQTDLTVKQENNELEVEYHNTYEVHRLPYKRSFRDKLTEYPLLKPLQKALTLNELILSNWSIRCLPFANFYPYSKQLIKEHSNIKVLIASGRPFQLFSIGHKLKKDFPNILWIPDYRDEWTTNKATKSKSVLSKLILLFDKKSEKKWSSNSSSFITVSNVINSSISSLINKAGITVSNGFDDHLPSLKASKSNDINSLKLLYIGSVYPYQDFSILFQSILEINKALNSPKIELAFLGSFNNELQRRNLQKSTSIISHNVKLLDKVPNTQVQQYIQEADVLFLTEYINLAGCLPVKIFDYFNSTKPILLCPSDKSLMENFIKETESGYLANSKNDCKKILFELLKKKRAGKELIGPRNTKNAYIYTRKYQAEILAKALDSLLQKDE